MAAAAPVLPQLTQVLGPLIVGVLGIFASRAATKTPNYGSPIIASLQELDRRLSIDRSATRYQILTDLDGVAEELLGRQEMRQVLQNTGLTLEQAKLEARSRIDSNIGRIGPFSVDTPRFNSAAEAAAWYRSQRDDYEELSGEGDVLAQDQLRHDYSYYLGEIARLNRTLFFPPGWVLGEGGFEREVPPSTWTPPTGYVRAGDPRADVAGVPVVDPVTSEILYPPRAAGATTPGAGGGTVPGGLDVPGLAGGVAQGITTGFGGLLGITSAGLTAAGFEVFRNIGKGRHLGTLDCQTSTWMTMLTNIGRNVAAVALPLASLQSAQVNDVATYLSTKIVDSILAGSDVPVGGDLEQAPARAAELYKAKIRFGVQAHAWAAGMELAAPLKFMGLNQLSAAIADAAGFQRLAFATIGQVETAAVMLPMQQYAMRKYRSQLPGLVDIAMAYAKKELPPGPIPDGFPPRAAFTPADPKEPAANMYEQLARYGMPDWWIRTASHHLFLDPRMSEIVRMGQYFSPEIDPSTRYPTPFATKWIDARPWVLQFAGITRQEWDADWWLHWRIAVGGYAYEDIKVVRETIKRAVVRRDQTLMLDAITRMHREGFIGDVELEGLVREAWGQTPGPDGRYTFRGDPILARVRATQFRTDYEVRNDVKTLVLRAMTKGVESESEALRDLQKLGMPPARAKLEVLRAKLGLLPGVNLTIPLEGAGGEGEGE